MMRQRSGTETDSRNISGVGGGTCLGSMGGNAYLSGAPCGRCRSMMSSLSAAFSASVRGKVCAKLLAFVTPRTATTITFNNGRFKVKVPFRASEARFINPRRRFARLSH